MIAHGSLLEVEQLDVVYPRSRGRVAATHALRGVDLTLKRGEALGVVGESGSGKTTLGRAIVGLVRATGGTIRFDGEDITDATRARRRELAREIQVVFQDPYGSLNPMMTVADILAEPLRAAGLSRDSAQARIVGLLDRVRMPADAASRYPSEFSGGQRQRIAIARAIALEPRLIVCDEPVSALDMSTRALVLDILVEIQETMGVALLLITHDLVVVKRVCHRVMVMRRGEIVESGYTAPVIGDPQHPYTKRLLLASPVADPVQQKARRAALAAMTEGDGNAV